MYALSEEKYQAEAAPALHRVFAYEDPWHEPFANGVEVRRLLYPVHAGLRDLDYPLLDALVSVATRLEDDGFYVSIIERPTPDSEWSRRDDWHWYLPFAEIEAYGSLGDALSLERTLYSPSGRWGLMISHEDHALLGGEAVFFEAMREAIPGFDNIGQVQHFLSDWRYYNAETGADVSWIPDLLTHVYGPELAEKMLEDAAFKQLL